MITEQDYHLAATLLGCEVASIKAVAEVESRGAGFDEQGRLKILFEPHIFWQQLEEVGINPVDHIKGNTDILAKKWNPSLYGKYSVQWDKMKRAAVIHEKAAMMSASYGMFQIMGFNCVAAGYPNIWAFINALALGEGEHLRAVSTLIANKNWDRQLRAKDWAKFAELYNGSSYKDNKYDIKLQIAYNKYKNA